MFVGLVLYVVCIASFVRIARADKYDIGSEQRWRKCVSDESANCVARFTQTGGSMDILAFLILVLLLVGIGRMVLATLAIQKNTREVADYFNWLRERQELQAAGKQKPIMSPGVARAV